ncbi:MAG TPA: DUF5683 domain-containing protein [Bacteroidia bacterium]
MKGFILLLIIMISPLLWRGVGGEVFAQTNPAPKDTTVSEKAVKKFANKEAHKAAIMSTILPGLGQAYNKKFWKIPFVYAALAGMGYLVYYEEGLYQEYHKELLLRYKYNNDPTLYTLHHPDQKLIHLPTSDINTEKILYQKRLDMCIIGIGFVYILNIIDASIDGHMKTFDVSDNLSLSIKPKTFYCIQNPRSFGVGFTMALTFKK